MNKIHTFVFERQKGGKGRSGGKIFVNPLFLKGRKKKSFPENFGRGQKKLSLASS